MLINKNAISNTYTVEVVIPSGSTSLQFFFPDVPYLRDKLITGVTTSTSQTGVSTGLGNIAVSVSGINMFVTFQTFSGEQFIQNIPAIELTNNLGGSNTVINTNTIWGFAPRNIVFPKSFIYFPSAGFATGSVAQFNIFYLVP